MLKGIRKNLADKFRIKNFLIREFLAELLATFFFLLIGISANIQATSSVDNIISTQLAWGFGFTFAVYIAADISGGHLNPAISLSYLLTGDLSFMRFVLYVIAQCFGAFLGTVVAYFGHIDELNNLFKRKSNVITPFQTTSEIFAMFPPFHITIFGSLIDQIIGTAILSGVINLLTDKKQKKIPSSIIPLLAGVTMTMIAMTFGTVGGFAINPARDFGPRLLLFFYYGWRVYSDSNYYFLVPIIGPIIGAIIGTLIYKIFIGLHGAHEKVDIFNRQPYLLNDPVNKVSSTV